MKKPLAILVLALTFIGSLLFTHNEPNALDHVRVDISGYEDIDHAR